MDRSGPKPAPYGVREVTLVAVTGAYLVLILLMVSNLLPVQSYIEDHSSTGFLATTMQKAMHLPYLEPVRSQMYERGFSEADIAAKLGFLAASFVIMISLYVIAACVGFVVFLIQGIRKDPTTIRFEELTTSQHIAAIPVFGAIFGGACLAFWVAIDGLSQNTGPIILSNFAIDRSMLFFTAALLLTIFLVRIFLCYVALALNVVARSS